MRSIAVVAASTLCARRCCVCVGAWQTGGRHLSRIRPGRFLQPKCGMTRIDVDVQEDNDVAHQNSFVKPNLSPNYNRIGGRRISLSDADSTTTTPTLVPSIDVLRTALSITAATVISILLVDEVTMRFETIQEWRYAWPLIGSLYVASGLSPFLSTSNADDEDSLQETVRQVSAVVPLPSNRLVSTVAALSGVGVLIGGYMDAFFPVWYTSPDVLGTRAGIEADSAAILLILTIFSTLRNIDTYRRLEHTGAENGESLLGGFQFPSWAVDVVLCTQLWEISAPTFYSLGEMLGIVS